MWDRVRQRRDHEQARRQRSPRGWGYYSWLIVGIVLRWDLIDWLIDAAGLVLIIVGIILIVIGVVQAFSGGGRKSGGYS